MQDLAEQIDSGIPASPTGGPDLDRALREGRRAVLRRRLATGTGALAVAAVIAGTAWLLSPGSDETASGGGFAGEPSSAADPWTDEDAVAVYDPHTGELRVREGWTVVDRTEDPITGPVPSDFGADHVDDSVGLVLTNGEAQRWILTWYADDPTPDDTTTDGTGASGASAGVPGDEFESFDRWLDYTSATLLSEPGGEVWGTDAAMLEPDGTLVIKPGWQVAEQVDDIAGRGTVAVDMVRADDPTRHQWFIFSKRMTIASLNAPEPGYATFQSWIDVNGPLAVDGGQGAGQAGPHRWPGVERDDLVRFGDGSDLVPLDGVTVVQQQPDPDVGDSFATADDTSAVALVETGGERWFVLARDLPDSPPQYIGVPATKGGDTIDEFLEFTRERYAEGGGGLL